MTDLKTRETSDIIAADKVEGTPVFGASRDRMGDVKSIMINKRTGKVEYAVLSIGGVLGMGAKLHPVPWSKLDYNTELDGFLLNVTVDQLKKAPTFEPNEGFLLNPDRRSETEVYSYYGEQPPRS